MQLHSTEDCSHTHSSELTSHWCRVWVGAVPQRTFLARFYPFLWQSTRDAGARCSFPALVSHLISLRNPNHSAMAPMHTIKKKKRRERWRRRHHARRPELGAPIRKDGTQNNRERAAGATVVCTVLSVLCNEFELCKSHRCRRKVIANAQVGMCYVRCPVMGRCRVRARLRGLAYDSDPVIAQIR